MRKVLKVTLMIAAGAALYVAGTRFGGHDAPHRSAEGGRKVLYYVDPMNPAHTSDRPGLAPCGMKMEPVYAESGTGAGSSSAPGPAAPGTMRLNTERQQLIGVRLSPVENSAGSYTLRLFGRVVPDERRVYRLNAGVEGIVREVSAVTTGTRVKKDEWLATFSAPDTRTTILGFLTAVDVVDRQTMSGANSPAQLSIVNDNVRLAADRLQTLGLSSIQIEEIHKTRQVPAALRILAPADGLVLAQSVTPGLKFEKGAEWYRIADLEKVWVLADVSAQDAEHVRPGVEAQIVVAGERKTMSARVSEASPQFDPLTRTLKVRLEVDNAGTFLRPEMLVDVLMPVTLPPAVTVPADAVVDSGLRATVFVSQGDGAFEQREVQTGRRLNDIVEIVSGLEAGEQVVTSGVFLLDSESRMKAGASGNLGAAINDPVCGMKVDASRAQAARWVTKYQGRTYYFCNQTCKESFDKAPTSFAEKSKRALAGRGSEQHSLALHAHTVLATTDNQ